MRVRGAAVTLSLVCALLAAPLTATASVPRITADTSPLTLLAEQRRSATRTAEALRALTGTSLPIPRPNGRWLLTFRTRADAAHALAAPLLAGTGARAVTRRVVLLDRLPQGLDPDAVTAALPGAVATEADKSGYRATRDTDDPLLAEQWAHQQARAFDAWDVTVGEDDVLVAVIDSGIWSEHPDLRGQVVEQVRTETGEVLPGRTQNDACGSGHGTAVAGIIAAAGDNGTGVAGVAHGVRLLDIGAEDVTEECPVSGFSIAAVIAGIDYAMTRTGGEADVINMSLGGFGDSCETAFQAAIDDARADGAVLVAASGNEQETDAGLTQTPASCNGVISVGATDRDGDVTSYSQRNRHVDLVAPGGGVDREEDGILTTSLGLDLYARDAGTSFAAPYVSGVAALLESVDDSLSPDEIESVLEASAEDLGPVGRDAASGWGLVDAAGAVDAAVRGGPIAEPAEDPDFPVGGDEEFLPGPPTAPEAYRIDATGAQDGIGQAVAISEILFEESEAPYAVLARSDHFADALAGSGLAYGVAPLLFTPSTAGLDPRTAAELERAVEPDAVVYLLGGTAAIPATVEAELTARGFAPVRLSGPSREHTAAAVAAEIAALEIWDGDLVLLAQSGDWPDAITGGAVAAWYGLPILLTPTTALHPVTAQALAALDPLRLAVLGGTGAVSQAVAAQAGDAGRVPAEDRLRWSGPTRSDTAVLIAATFEGRLLEEDVAPSSLIAVNVRHPLAYAPALGAAMIAGMLHTPFVPVEGADGSVLPDVSRAYVRDSGYDIIAVGGRALVTDAVLAELRDLSEG